MSRPWLRVVILGLAGAAHAGGAEPVQTRCGWWDNPSPGNAWLIDRDGAWEVAIQGGHQAEGDWPEIPARQKVRVNGSYGYGCACLQVRVTPQTRQVSAILSAKAQPLAQCRSDKALGKPPG